MTQIGFGQVRCDGSTDAQPCAATVIGGLGSEWGALTHYCANEAHQEQARIVAQVIRATCGLPR